MSDLCSAGGVLGLFPSIGALGGIQVSGSIAWDGIQTHEHGSSPGGRPATRRFCHCGPAGRRSCVGQPAIHAASKPGAIATALGRRWPAELVLIWHLGLLKLLPFFHVGNARVALFLHGVEVWRRPDWLTRGLLRRVDLFLSNSDFTWQRFLAESPELANAPHRTVPLGIGAARVGPVPTPAARPAALMLGRLARSEDYKGHREVIAAWPLVRERRPEAELWIAGDGDLRPRLERLAVAHGIAGQVRFWGEVSEGQKEALLERSRCLLLPSHGEGFGLVYLEAMRLARPCLVSTLDAGREVVDPPRCGLAADPRDPVALADSIGRLLEPGPRWEAWSSAARERYESGFTARHFQERLRAALATLRTSSPASSGQRVSA